MCFVSLIGRDTALVPQQEEERILPSTVKTQPVGDFHSSASEKSLHSELSVSSNRLFIYNSPSEVHKRSSSPLFL